MRVRVLSRARSPLVGLGALWLLSVAISSALAPRYAEIVHRIGLAEPALATALAAETLGLGVVLLVVAPRLAARWGPRPVALAGATGFALTAPLVGLASSGPALAGAFLLAGVLTALLDLGMTQMAADAERRTGRTLLGYLNVPAALGGLAATAAGAWSAGRVDVEPYAVLVGAAGVLVALLAWPLLPAATAGVVQDHARPALPLGRRVALGALAAASLGMELAVLDWASLLMAELGAPQRQWGLASLAFIGGATLAFLLVGRAANRFGRTRVLQVSAVVGIAAMLVATLTSSPAWVAVALGVAGLGLVPAHPLALSAAGAATGRDLALVMTLGYAGLMAVRAAVGGLASVAGVQLALGTITIALSLLVLALARATGERAAPTAR